MPGGGNVGGRLILLTDGVLADRVLAKTAWCLMRFAPERVGAVVDATYAGASVADVCPGLDVEMPVVATVDEVAEAGDTLVVATARPGGALSADQRTMVESASARGLRILNGTHDVVDSPGVVNIRRFDPADRELGVGRPRGTATRILTVGTTSSVGKMTVTVLLTRSLQAAGVQADWLPTGQTGVMLRGTGHALDAVPLDFAPGVLESDLEIIERHASMVVIEGQGALLHPVWGAANFIFTKVARPDWILVCARMGRPTHVGFDVPVPNVEEVVAGHQALAAMLGHRHGVLGVALDSADVDRAAYEAEAARVTGALGVPCVDPVRDGVDAFVSRLLVG